MTELDEDARFFTILESILDDHYNATAPVIIDDTSRWLDELWEASNHGDTYLRQTDYDLSRVPTFHDRGVVVIADEHDGTKGLYLIHMLTADKLDVSNLTLITSMILEQ